MVWVQDVGEFSDAQARSQLWSEQAPDIVKMRGEARVAELDALLGAVNATGLTVTPARVVSFPMTSLDSSHVVVDVGSDDGIELDAAVLTGAGVVGRTISTAAGTTDIKPISARDSAIGCRFLRTGQACIAQGTGDPASMTVRLIDPIADVKVGDTVLTFGSRMARRSSPTCRSAPSRRSTATVGGADHPAEARRQPHRPGSRRRRQPAGSPR